ncbi:HEPN domain-containing protein [Shewanella putrefaciens]|uniref:HEPN domain-containing protein n=1 Tax=Shewanella putrefaciens TaxID=24 RepID=UPI0018E79B46|nr:HEPN domain-containing protein [Shewanella putrefaciens]
MSDYREVVFGINDILDDKSLERINNFSAEDPIQWAKKLGASVQSINFMELLARKHPSFCRKFIRFGYSSGEINPFLLAKWLMLRARVVGAEEAYKSVLLLESNDVVYGFNVSLIRGLDFTGSIDFIDGIKLVDYKNLPKTILKSLEVKMNLDNGSLHPPYTFLIQPLCDNLFDSNRPLVDDSLHFYVDHELLVVNFLSLFSEHYAPTVDRRWCILNDDVPMSGICDNQYSYYLEIEPPKIHSDFKNVKIKEVELLFQKYMAMPHKLRLQIDISLSRRVKSMNTWNYVNKAIDLGIALESVLTAPRTSDQLSLQVRLLGSKLARTEFEQRRKVYSILKAVYTLRSLAVHNGEVTDQKIKGEDGKKPAREILDLGLNILSDCLKEIINRNGLSEDDIERLLIE